ncbi:hypothetical protein H2248_006150 [Termitomyces sp. 'cryptogamus']|nr:hypothetical protein H2248_006150 [Termitomyces sp. 'cryptogamus']
MRSFFLLTLTCIATATPLSDGQTPLIDAGHLTSYPGFSLDLNAQRLVELEGKTPIWMSELDKVQLKAKGIRFFDVTDTQTLGFSAHTKLQTTASFPSPNATERVKPILRTLSTKGPRENLKKFSSFRTRHYRSDVRIQFSG